VTALAVMCALAPAFGTLLTPGGGKLQSASYSRPLSTTCEVALLGESWDATVGVTLGYDLKTSLVDSRLYTIGARRRLYANPAWAKPADEQVVLQHTTTRPFDPYVIAAAGLIDNTIYGLDDAENVSARSIQAFGAVLGGGVDWYLLSDQKSPRGASWRGAVLVGEARLALLPLALRDPAVQAVLAQVLVGGRYVF
jgi:hypothetical protein